MYSVHYLLPFPFFSLNRLTHSQSEGWHSSSNQGTPKFISLAGLLLVCDTLSLADSHQHCLDDQLASLNSQHRHNALNSPVDSMGKLAKYQLATM